MSLQNRIEKNAEYFRSIEMLSGYPILKAVYPEKWGVYPSNDGKIQVTRSDNSPNEWFYFTTEKEITLDDMFDLLEQTIHMNKSAIAKVELLRVKIEELKNLFSNETLENLQGLEFHITNKSSVQGDGKKTKKPRKSRKKTMVEMSETKEEVVEVTSNE